MKYRREGNKIYSKQGNENIAGKEMRIFQAKK